MKRKALVFTVLILLLSLLTGFSVPSSGVILADNLSEKAAAQLFVPYEDTGIFAYTDGNTYILKTDGSASCTAAYPASHVFLRGQSVIAVSPMENITVAEHFDADSLTRSNINGLKLSETDILDLDADSFGRIYAVRNSEPDVLHIFDAAGSHAGQIPCPVNILGIQVLSNQLYLFLPEQCLIISLEQSLPQTYVKAFTYSSSAAPFCMLDTSTYISTNGIVYSTTGAALTTTGHYALYKTALAAGNGALFWAEADSAVIRYCFADQSTASFSLPGTAAALTDTAAVVRMDDQYKLISYGDFNSAVTPAPTAVPSGVPSAAPSSSPSPSQTPSPLPGVIVSDGYIYVPADTTAAALRNSLPYEEVEICTVSMTHASGKIRTGWAVITPDAQYTLIVPGDVNSSGTVNSVDLRLMQQFLLGAQIPEEVQILAGDLNKSGSPDAADLVLLVDLMQ